MLQWGHDKIVMEVNPVTSETMIGQELQWGHDKIVMEVHAPDKCPDNPGSFNGAMTK